MKGKIMDKSRDEKPAAEPVYRDLEGYFLTRRQEAIGQVFHWLAVLSAVFGLLIHLHYGTLAVGLSGFLMGYFTLSGFHRRWLQPIRALIALVIFAVALCAFFLAYSLPAHIADPAMIARFHSGAVVFIVALFALGFTFVSSLLTGHLVRSFVPEN